MVDERAVVVARRAVALAAAAGIDLPDDLSLWSLAGGRPLADPADGEPDELGRLLEASFAPAERQRQGAHFTPTALADDLAARALVGHEGASVGDPACGGGALLLAAGRRLAAGGEDPTEIVGRLWGADIDPLAVATTEVALTLWAGSRPPTGNLVVADSLLDDLVWPRLDVVVGNPPFLTPLGAHTARDGSTGDRLRERYGPAVRAYTDAAGLFLLRACHRARVGRWRWSSRSRCWPRAMRPECRGAVGAVGRLVDVLVPTRAGFEAAVEVCVPVIEVGSPSPAPGGARTSPRPTACPPSSCPAGERWATKPRRRRRSEASTTAWSTTSTRRPTCRREPRSSPPV